MNFIAFLKSNYFLKHAAIALVVFLMLFFALTSYLSYITNHDQKIQVPDLSKLQMTTVQQVLEELDLRYEVIDSSSFNPDYPRFSVVDQSPKAGAFVKENRMIYLTLNPSKFGNVEIQEFYGRPKSEVEAQLRSSGFLIGTYTYIPDLGENVVRGLNFKGKPVFSGDKLTKRSVINLVLGDGQLKVMDYDSTGTSNEPEIIEEIN